MKYSRDCNTVELGLKKRRRLLQRTQQKIDVVPHTLESRKLNFDRAPQVSCNENFSYRDRNVERIYSFLFRLSNIIVQPF